MLTLKNIVIAVTILGVAFVAFLVIVCLALFINERRENDKLYNNEGYEN